MTFTSFAFIGFISAVVLIFSVLKTETQRSWIFLGANLLFIAAYVDSVLQLLPLAVFLLLGYLGVIACRRTGSSAVLWFFNILVLVSFIFFKKFSFVGSSLQLPFAYLLIGFSYVLFRMIHMMVDAKQGELSRPISLLQFLNYTCNFLSFVAGPIQRYQDFAAQAVAPVRLQANEVFSAMARIVKGFLKLGVVSAVGKYIFDSTSSKLLDPSAMFSSPQTWALFASAAIVYTIYLYANFAGYMDIVIGVGQLMGFQLPENFNRPFLARNFLDFWSRWHMTLSDWFKTYVFNPLLKRLAIRFTSAASSPYLGVVAFFVTFLIMGAWHGTTSVFVIYGLLMGAGASVNKLWQVMAVKRLGKKRYKSLTEKSVAIYFSRGLTFAYFAIALTCLWVNVPQLTSLWQKINLIGLVVCYFGIAALAGTVFFLLDCAIALLQPVTIGVTAISSGAVARNFVLAFQILLIFTVSSFFHKAPEFVYRAF